MAQPFFSVVMPVYNVEAHLEKAVRSVLTQTFSDFELILVDDCSPDGSGKIADRLAAEDARIRVIHLPQNGGLSNARNQGIDAAGGLYVFFMDSDDSIESALLQDAYIELQCLKADIVAFGMTEDYYDQSGRLDSTANIRFPKTICHTPDEVHACIIHLEESTLFGYVCNKIYLLAHLRESGVRFRTITLVEDILFNVDFADNIHSMIVLDTAPYHYNKRLDNSLTSKFLPNYFELSAARVQAVFDQYKRWNACDATVLGILGAIYVRYLFSALQRNCDARSNMTHRERREWLVQLYDTALFQDLMPFAKPGSRLVKVMHHLIWKRHIALSLIAGRVIYIIKNKFPMLFARAKQHR